MGFTNLELWGQTLARVSNKASLNLSHSISISPKSLLISLKNLGNKNHIFQHLYGHLYRPEPTVRR